MFSIFHSALIIFCVFLDQGLKFIANTKFSFYKPIFIIKPYISFQLVHNYGAAYGLFQHQKFLLLLVGFLVLIFGYLFRYKLAPTKISKLGLCFLYAGALGNFLNRLLLGYVVDFINITIFPVFNIADVLIDLGVAFYVLDLFISKNDSQRTRK